ncbi:MAG: prepilin-type N-terminal cleavage/methylation domain-containing protein [Candidatus Omnitrophota bacterium]
MLGLVIKNKAFTLTEMMAVIAIITVVAATTLVSFAKLGNTKLDADINKVVADLSWLRQVSISSHQNYGVSIDTVNRSYSLYVSPTGTIADFIPANFLKKTNLDAALASSANAAWFYFPQGRSSAVSITLTKSGRSRDVTLFDSGYVKKGP